MLKLNLTLLAVLALSRLFGQQVAQVYLDPNDSTRSTYLIIQPSTLPWAGYLVLLPGLGESAERVLEQTDLPLLAARNGIVTIIPALQDGVLSLGVDSTSQHALNTIIAHARSAYELADLRFFIGGFSLGGSSALRHAQEAALRPTAVFGVDPPLDLERFYHSAKRDIRLSAPRPASHESLYMIERLEDATGGSPATHLAAYHALSPYSFSDTAQTAVRKLAGIPLRIYAEPDVHWWMRERQADLTSMNVTECSALINELHRLGSSKAELLLTANKGYRKPAHQRHPHAWSIVDNGALIDWLLGQE